MHQPKIKVFWDLVSCPPPAVYASPWEVLKDVRLFTSNFGVVTSIKAYWDRNKAQHADARAEIFRDTMPSVGVNLVDCSTMQGYAGDALTKMLTVDVVISAMDDPVNTDTLENDIIMIISGDKSVLYPISLLMFRNYTTFLAVPDESNNVQPFQATRVFNWHRDVLGYKFNLSPEPTSVPVAESPNPEERGWTANGTHVPQLNLDTTTMSVSPSNPSAAGSAPSVYMGSAKPVTTVTTPAATPKSKARSVSASEPPASRAPSALNPRSPASGNFGVAPDEDTSSGPNSSTSGSLSPLSHQPEVSRSPEPEEDIVDDWGAASNWDAGNPSGGWEMNPTSWASEPPPKPKIEPKKAEAKAKPPAPKARQSRTRTRAPAWESRSTTSEATRTESEIMPDPPMSAFDPLLQVLRESEEGSVRRSQIGELLARAKPGLYETAGVRGLSEYLSVAAKKNLIVLCGIDNYQRVKLKGRK
ncbi:hypothetical protein P691DRAFT_800919 [Macrolepiota fuliginosa MF-IS2]|uniref:NYN domain-containing protein n=1 Tax=Macrolepiota fuliginosa MF-IS2 TaxID=1400762 RepID=A0A9P5XCU9_9AGAR|nr:hypothetical protein P691DRAFT_800919 [Macrolepiota fuliginosa MF-IS2]